MGTAVKLITLWQTRNANLLAGELSIDSLDSLVKGQRSQEKHVSSSWDSQTRLKAGNGLSTFW